MAGKCTIIDQGSVFGNRELVIEWNTGLGPNPAQVHTLYALNGSSPDQFPSGTIIMQRLSGASDIRLKGLVGDTGILLRGTDPTIFCPITTPYVITTTSASDITLVEV